MFTPKELPYPDPQACFPEAEIIAAFAQEFRDGRRTIKERFLRNHPSPEKGDYDNAEQTLYNILILPLAYLPFGQNVLVNLMLSGQTDRHTTHLNQFIKED